MQAQQSLHGSTLKQRKSLYARKNYLKALEHAKRIHGEGGRYKDDLLTLMAQANRVKLGKIVEEVKQSNSGFRRYLERKRVERLRGEDVLHFEARMESEGEKVARRMGGSGEQERWLELQIVRLGFMTILERLLTDRANHCLNEYRYLKEEISRETAMLGARGQRYKGTPHQDRAIDLMGEMGEVEQRYGQFDLINGKAREETEMLQGIAQHLKDQVMRG